MSVLEAKGLSIRYIRGDFKDIGLKEYLIRRLKGNYRVEEFWADWDVNFSLERGDMLGIIGANGAGKSTLLKAISGIMVPTLGTIRREGTIAALLELASGFDGDLTVKENAYLRGAMLGYTRSFMDQTYRQIIDFAELGDFENRPFKQLSSGMKSRLAFSVACMVKPDILILDEVLAVGDGAFRRKSEAKMREIIGGGATTILVSHSLEQVRKLCNKVLWLHKGKQIAFGDDVAAICDGYQDFLGGGVKLDSARLLPSRRWGKIYDYLIVGAGLFGAVCACELRKAGKSCLVIDRRDHIAGNAYTQELEGIQVHRYGAHIFHTNNDGVWNYVRRFAQFNRFTNSPIANYRGEIYNLPFNMNTFNRMWGVVTPEEAKKKIESQRIAAGIEEPRNLEEQAISLVGRDIYEKLIKGYTSKQWGRPCSELPAFIIRRLPVRFSYDNNYFEARHQGIPVGGYTAMVEKMLEGVEVRLGCDYLKDRIAWNAMARRIIYTGPIDEYFNFCFGALEYRSLRFETEVLDTDNYQGNAVVNYTDEAVPYTRIIEHKHFQLATQPKIAPKKLSPRWKSGDEPYYTVGYRDRAHWQEEMISTGPLSDGGFCFAVSALEEDGLGLESEILKFQGRAPEVGSFRPSAAADYSGTPCVRLVEQGYFVDRPRTVITREYSVPWKRGDEPYYPVNDGKNMALYQRYRALADRESRVTFGGRLGEYRYYDMDQVIASALRTVRELKKR